MTMMWAKTPAAAGSIFCAACIAAASVLPTVGPAADQLAKTMSADVNLKVRFDKLANFDAIPIYQAAAAGDVTAIFALQSLNAIPAYLTFGLTGNTDVLGALASLSGVPVYAHAIQAGTGDPALLAGIDNFSGIPGLQKIANGDRTGYYDNATTNATQAFDKWAASGYTDLGAFEPNLEPDDPADFNAGYAALSGLNTYKKANTSGNVADLAGIDAFSAIPALQVLGNPASTQADIWAAQRALASISAIPEYQDAPDPPAPPAPVAPEALKVASEESSPQIQAKTAFAPAPAPAAAAAAAPAAAAAAAPEVTPKATEAAPAAVKTEKPSNGSYSGSFSPPSLVLFGSGSGKNAADNGIRGWGDAVNGVRGALGLGPDPSTQSADSGAGAGGATP